MSLSLSSDLKKSNKLSILYPYPFLPNSPKYEKSRRIVAESICNASLIAFEFTRSIPLDFNELTNL